MALDIFSAVINSILFWIGASVITACFCGWYAKKHGDSWGEWFVLGAIYPFFIAIPAIIFCSVSTKK
jgi:hypothetical protein